MKSLIFSAPMVLALLDGRKTQTRRVIKPEPRLLRTDLPPNVPHGTDKVEHWTIPNRCDGTWASPLRVGDTLYVRETLRLDPGRGWTYAADGSPLRCQYEYLATMNEWIASRKQKTQSSMFMPAWAPRLHLTITDVRVQRVQDISPSDADREGYPIGTEPCCLTTAAKNRIGWYRQVWSDLHGPASWDANPWVWAYTFMVKKIGGA